MSVHRKVLRRDRRFLRGRKQFDSRARVPMSREEFENTPNFTWGIISFCLRVAEVVPGRSSLARHSRREWRAREEQKISESGRPKRNLPQLKLGVFLESSCSS